MDPSQRPPTFLPRPGGGPGAAPQVFQPGAAPRQQTLSSQGSLGSAGPSSPFDQARAQRMTSSGDGGPGMHQHSNPLFAAPPNFTPPAGGAPSKRLDLENAGEPINSPARQFDKA